MADGTTSPTLPEFCCSVSANIFARVDLARSLEEARYYLNGVFVQPAADGGAVLVATNGHFMIVAHDKDAYVNGSAIVRVDKIVRSELKKETKDRRQMTRRLVATQSRVGVIDVVNGHEASADDAALIEAPTADTVALQWRDALIDGSFPDWRRVLPKPAEISLSQPVSFNPKYLPALQAALSIDGQARGVISIRVTDHTSPALVVGDLPHLFGVVMPMRARADATLPDWTRALPPEPVPTPQPIAKTKKRVAAAVAKKPARRAAPPAPKGD